NGAKARWHEVEVLPPPQLVPLEGRPSPQVHLTYPAYTDVPPQDAPDGASSIEAVAGTAVTLRAATDRPLSGAWLEYPGELTPALTLAAHPDPLTPLHPPAVMSELALARRAAWQRISARLSPDRQVFTLDFTARVGGSFVLHFVDENGLPNSRLIELLVAPDPPPTVSLERPSRTQDSLDVLPGAVVTLQVLAEDPLFAVRSVYLEYRRRKLGSTAETATPQRLPLYDHRIGWAVPLLLSKLAATPITVPASPWRLRPQRVPVARRW